MNPLDRARKWFRLRKESGELGGGPWMESEGG
jgi:hypothetical protein